MAKLNQPGTILSDMLQGRIVTLEMNPLSMYGAEIDCQIKYYKTDKVNHSEKCILKALEKISLRKIKKFIWASMERSCYCEHDCCGHWFTTSIDVKRISRNKFSVVLKYAQNY